MYLFVNVDFVVDFVGFWGCMVVVVGVNDVIMLFVVCEWIVVVVYVGL